MKTKAEKLSEQDRVANTEKTVVLLFISWVIIQIIHYIPNQRTLLKTLMIGLFLAVWIFASDALAIACYHATSFMGAKLIRNYKKRAREIMNYKSAIIVAIGLIIAANTTNIPATLAGFLLAIIYVKAINPKIINDKFH